MGIKSFFENRANVKAEKIATLLHDKLKADALFTQQGNPLYNGSRPIMLSEAYNGEKNAGELGSIKNYVPDFESLSGRSWQAYTESEVGQIGRAHV